MSINAYLIGETVRVSVAIADVTAIAADPGALRLKTKSPSGTVISTAYGGGTVIKDATGSYHADLVPSESGTWNYRWEADAPNGGATEGAFSVIASKVL